MLVGDIGGMAMRHASRARSIVVFGMITTLVMSATAVSASDEEGGSRGNSRLATQQGLVEGGNGPIANSKVTIWEAGKHPGQAKALGSSTTEGDGQFSVDYRPRNPSSVLYVVAEGPESGVRLATVLGVSGFSESVVLNERTTVAAAYAMAQFIEDGRIGGPEPGLPNASTVFRNIVDPANGEIGSVLGSSPNGAETSALPTVNTLANMLAPCVASANCDELFELSAQPGEQPATDTFSAMVDIAHNPGNARWRSCRRRWPPGR